jgi:hypothetical protein
VQHGCERARVKIDVDDKRTGWLGFWHSDRGRAERASGKTRSRHSERLLAGVAEIDLGVLAVLASRGRRRAAKAGVDRQTVTSVEPGLQGDVVAVANGLSIYLQSGMHFEPADRLDLDGVAVIDLVPLVAGFAVVVREGEAPPGPPLGSSRASHKVPTRYSPAGTVTPSTCPCSATADPSRLINVACSSVNRSAPDGRFNASLTVSLPATVSSGRRVPGSSERTA